MIDDASWPERRARRGLVRSALITTPPFVLFTVLTTFNLIRAAEGNSGVWIVTALTALITILFATTAVKSLLDLFGDPIEVSGLIKKKWIRSDFFLLRRYYVEVGDVIFRVRKDQFRSLPAADRPIGIYHFPHTQTVIDWWPLSLSQAPGMPEARAPVFAAEATRVAPRREPPRPAQGLRGSLAPRHDEWNSPRFRSPPARPDEPHRTS